MKYNALDAGLERIGLTLSDVAADFIWIGGSDGRHAKYFKLKYPDEPHPSHSDYCVCGHQIVENCYIRSTVSGQTLIVGNCCVKRYVPSAGRTCKECGAEHKNRVIDMCNVCRPKLRKCKKVCERCAAPHQNRKDNLCSDCRIIPPCLGCAVRRALWPAGEYAGHCHGCCPPPPPAREGLQVHCDFCARPCKPPYTTCWDCNNGGRCSKCQKACPTRFKKCWNCR